jgi:hypothetical protein
MGCDASAIICLGITLDEGGEYPWSEKGDMKDWWLDDVCKYVPPFKLYDETGDYLNGIKPPKKQIDDYYEHLHEFKKNHPLPVDCSHYGGDDPTCILTVLETEKRVSWDEPLELDPNITFSVKEENLDLFKKFCKDYLGIDDVQPKWLLSAYYG